MRSVRQVRQMLRLNVGLTKRQMAEYLAGSQQHNREFIIRQKMRMTLVELEHAYVDAVGHRNLTPAQREMTVARQHANHINRMADRRVVLQSGSVAQHMPTVD